jgi:DNA-binding transcriptional ArsR family regulator
MDRTKTNRGCRHEVLACIGVASRFRLIQILSESEMCVSDLAIAVGLSQSCTTRHLQALGSLGIVEGRREGKRVRFRLRSEDPLLAHLIAWTLAQSLPGASESESPPRIHRSGSRAGRPGRPLAGEIADGPDESEPKKRLQGGRTSAGVDGKVDRGQADAEPVREPSEGSFDPIRRPGDLDDYLL